MADVMGQRTGEQRDHVVQFYATDAELVSVAGDSLAEALTAGGVAVVIATGEHRRAVEAHLRDRGIDVDAARGRGALVELDAAATLARFVRDGSVDREAFSEVVGTVLRDAAATGRRVQAFGEMVALLWQAGAVAAAIDLETAWEELVAETGCSLHCAYRGESVRAPELAASLERVCGLHSAVVDSRSRGVAQTWDFELEDGAAARARHRLVEALRRSGHDGVLLEDARMVVAELAANAVRHAGSPFSVTLRRGPASVRIEVRDGSRIPPAPRQPDATTPSGRGLHLVAALASRWGVDLLPEGKLVWAELEQ